MIAASAWRTVESGPVGKPVLEDTRLSPWPDARAANMFLPFRAPRFNCAGATCNCHLGRWLTSVILIQVAIEDNSGFTCKTATGLPLPSCSQSGICYAWSESLQHGVLSWGE